MNTILPPARQWNDSWQTIHTWYLQRMFTVDLDASNGTIDSMCYDWWRRRSLNNISHQYCAQYWISTHGAMTYLFTLTGCACDSSGWDGELSWGWLVVALRCSCDWLPPPPRCNMNWDGSIRFVLDGNVSPNKTRTFAIAKRTARRSCIVDLVQCQHCFLRHMG